MSPLGHDRACDHHIIAYAINLYAALKELNLNGHDNCTYRKTGYQGAQPDLSYYIEENANVIPFFIKYNQLTEKTSANFSLSLGKVGLKVLS